MTSIKVSLSHFQKELAIFLETSGWPLTHHLLPGLMICMLYTFLGNALSSQFSWRTPTGPTAVVENHTGQPIRRPEPGFGDSGRRRSRWGWSAAKAGPVHPLSRRF